MSLKEIKTRIQSVQNTRKITSAMKMVASAKLHHAQEAISSMLPYQNMLYGILSRFLAEGESVQTAYQQERELNNVALIVFSSNSSLCGAFNSNMICPASMVLPNPTSSATNRRRLGELRNFKSGLN